jgi:hypothetical protein
MPEPTFDLAKAHRWFGVECNNTAWGLLEQPARTADETQQLLHAAHTALHHWAHIGTPINRLRGLSLLATAYTAAGQAEEAIRWASACLALSDRLGMPKAAADQHDADGQTSFDRACAHACAAAAFMLAEYADQAAEQERLARTVLADCDDEECEVVEKFYSITP